MEKEKRITLLHLQSDIRRSKRERERKIEKDRKRWNMGDLRKGICREARKQPNTQSQTDRDKDK